MRLRIEYSQDARNGARGSHGFFNDDRLIHGQIVAYWSNELKLTRLMVANDGVAADDMRKAVLRMAAPPGVRTSIIPVERAARQIMDGRYAGQRVLLIVDSPRDVLRLLELGMPIGRFNLGNIGGKEGARTIANYVNITEDQERELLDRGIDIVMQIVPQGAVTHVSDHLDRTAS